MKPSDAAHLRVLADDDVEFPADVEPLRAVDQLCESLSWVLGWGIHRGGVLPDDVVWSCDVAAEGTPSEYLFVVPMEPEERMGHVHRVRATPSSNASSGARPLADVNEIASRLATIVHESNQWRRQCLEARASLAANIELPASLEANPVLLARTLHGLLRCAQEVAGVESAALFILDDDTRFLQMRASVGLDESHHAWQPRALKEARADLEALAGHAVVMETKTTIDAWGTPWDCQAAVCLPIASNHALWGTFWCASERAREFSREQVNMLEIIAGRIAAEIEREAVLRQGKLAWMSQTTALSFATSSELPPASLPLVTRASFQDPRWQATTRVSPPEIDRSQIVDVRGHGEGIDLTGTCAEENSLPGHTMAAFAFGELHRGGMQGQASQALQRVHQRLFRGSTGDEFVSAFHAHMDPETGQTQVLAAGHVDVFVIRPHAWEHLLGMSRPLGDGMHECTGITGETRLDNADWLLILAGCRPRTLRVHQTPLVDGKHVAEVLLRHFHLPISEAADALWALLVRRETIFRRPPIVALARRKVTAPTLETNWSPNTFSLRNH